LRPTTPFSSRRATDPAARALAGAAALVLILGLALAGCGGGGTGGGTAGDAGSASKGPPGAEGTAAPAFTLPSLDGRSVSLADFKGKVVIVNFWATWCPPCRAEIPDFVRFQSKYRDRGLAIVGLAMDAGGARDVRPFAEEMNINYTMLLGNDDIAQAYGGIVGIPTTFVVDRSGTIVKKFIGYTAPKVWEETLEPLLGPAT
jgi:cytochrome c biogenesis protein CcmG/thiol:disulfide interchange protein DsbE